MVLKVAGKETMLVWTDLCKEQEINMVFPFWIQVVFMSAGRMVWVRCLSSPWEVGGTGWNLGWEMLDEGNACRSVAEPFA